MRAENLSILFTAKSQELRTMLDMQAFVKSINTSVHFSQYPAESFSNKGYLAIIY